MCVHMSNIKRRRTFQIKSFLLPPVQFFSKKVVENSLRLQSLPEAVQSLETLQEYETALTSIFWSVMVSEMRAVIVSVMESGMGSIMAWVMGLVLGLF